jgi:hypothetical protein
MLRPALLLALAVAAAGCRRHNDDARPPDGTHARHDRHPHDGVEHDHVESDGELNLTPASKACPGETELVRVKVVDSPTLEATDPLAFLQLADLLEEVGGLGAVRVLHERLAAPQDGLLAVAAALGDVALAQVGDRAAHRRGLHQGDAAEHADRQVVVLELLGEGGELDGDVAVVAVGVVGLLEPVELLLLVADGGGDGGLAVLEDAQLGRAAALHRSIAASRIASAFVLLLGEAV